MIAFILAKLANLLAINWLDKLSRVFSMCLQFIQFLFTNWRITAPIIIVLAIAWYCRGEYNARVNERDVAIKQAKQAKHELQSLEWHIAEQVVLRQKQDAINRKLSDAATAKLEAEHQAEYAKHHINFKNVKKALENEKDNINAMLADAYELRVETAANVASGSKLREDASTAEVSTEGARDCHRTLATVVEACVATTLDYNTLRKFDEDNCKIYGCRDNDEVREVEVLK